MRIVTKRIAVSLTLLLASTTSRALAQIRVEVYAGQPFGVGHIELQVPPHDLPQPLGLDGLAVSEQNGRVYYPTIHSPNIAPIVKDILAETPLIRGGPIRERIGGLLGQILDQPPKTHIFFLFSGNEPLQLTLHTRTPHKMTVRPRVDPIVHKQLLGEWWKRYTASPGFFEQFRGEPDYPPLVENYLISTLATRLNLKLPEKKQTPSTEDVLRKQLALTLGTESVCIGMQQDRILGLTNLHLRADQPLPPPIEPLELIFPPPPGEVRIEPIAMRVPAECMYVRFGSFANFMWMQDTLAKWGGDAQNLVALRGLDHGMSQRMESQLILKQSVMARLFGSTVISDVAIVGTDMFMREGASFGLLFHATSSTFLAGDFARQRKERLDVGGATEKKLTIAGNEVSFITSTDGSVRSYYVADSDFHFVTTSETLVRRFLETGKGKNSLGASAEFRYARGEMPIKNEYSVFAYFSDAFFRNMVSPQYHIEMTRRLQALADLELLQLAVLAAATEGKPGGSIEELIAGGLLPKGFTTRPDGSNAVLRDGEVYDSLRGPRGRFVPIPDVDVNSVTRAEATAYRRFADTYRNEWGRVDPMTVGVKRHELPENRERVVVDVLASPLAEKHREMLAKWLGPADQVRLAQVPGDLAAMELLMEKGRLFGGMRDAPPPTNARARILPLGRLQEVLMVGYLGTTGELGLLDILDKLIVARPNRAGYAGNRAGLWRRNYEQFTVYSLQPQVLATVTPRLRFEKAERPAQFRLRVDDPTAAGMMKFLNGLGYNRTRETSLGNIRLMHTLDQQLHVPPEHCRAAAELLMDANLTCPLGGEYVLKETPGGLGRWTSTAIDQAPAAAALRPQAPQGFLAPPLNWFRGVKMDAVTSGTTISLHAEIIMQMPK